MTHQILATSDGNFEIVRFFERDEPEQEIFGRGDPAAVVMELAGGAILAVFPESDVYDQAVALADEAALH